MVVRHRTRCFKTAWLAIAFCALASGAKARNIADQAKDYVLAACLQHAYAGQPLAAETELWAQGLVEQGHVPGTAYKPLSDLAKRAPPPQNSSTGMPMLMQNCVDWHNSTQVKSAIRKILIGHKTK